MKHYIKVFVLFPLYCSCLEMREVITLQKCHMISLIYQL